MTTDLLKTPLHALHQAAGARLVPFAGYDMPVSYPDGIIKEHLYTRSAASLFDVSHMGQVEIRGDGVAEALERLIPVDIQSLPVGRQRYGFFTNAAGGIIDDLMVQRLADRFLLVLNASRVAVGLAHLRAHLPVHLDVVHRQDLALLAVQGPEAEAALLADAPALAGSVFMDVLETAVAGQSCLVSRSGYTGEDGFEISVAADAAEALVRRWLDAGRIRLAGLGARDSLRLEAGLCLYGHELDETVSPVEAGLGWAIQKVRRSGGARAGGFPGAERILAELEQGTALRRVGLLPEGRAPLREGTVLESPAGEAIGRITSGTFSPSLQKPIACGYLRADWAVPGTACRALLRGREVAVTVAEPVMIRPRYRRAA